MSRYRWVMHGGDKLHDVGIDADGSLYNPHNYPEDVVRVAVAAADERRHERRSRAAQKAGATRRRRQALKVYELARAIVAEQATGPSGRCALCRRKLSDAESIARGIGTECWGGVLEEVSRLRDTEVAR